MMVIASSFAQARPTFEAALRPPELLGEEGAYRLRDQQDLADIQHRETKTRRRLGGESQNLSARFLDLADRRCRPFRRLRQIP